MRRPVCANDAERKGKRRRLAAVRLTDGLAGNVNTETDMEHPATFTMHTPSGSTHCCVKHARQLEHLMRMLGAHTNAVKAPEGAECENCKNEAKKING